MTNLHSLGVTTDNDYFLDPDLKFQRPELIQFLEYWEQKRRGRQFPARADIQPGEMLDLLPWTSMFDVEDVDKFRVRLNGTKLEALLPEGKYTGKPISVFPPRAYARLQTTLEWVVLNRAALRGQSRSSSVPGQDYQGQESIFAPLSRNGVDIDIIASVTMLEKL